MRDIPDGGESSPPPAPADESCRVDAQADVPAAGSRFARAMAAVKNRHTSPVSQPAVAPAGWHGIPPLSFSAPAIVCVLAVVLLLGMVLGIRAVQSLGSGHAVGNYDIVWFDTSNANAPGSAASAYASHYVNGAAAAHLRAHFVWTTPFGTLTCSGVTDVSGTATCQIILPPAGQPYTVTVRVSFPTAGAGAWADGSFVTS